MGKPVAPILIIALGIPFQRQRLLSFISSLFAQTELSGGLLMPEDGRRVRPRLPRIPDSDRCHSSLFPHIHTNTNTSHAVYCVHHSHHPTHTRTMASFVEELWSSIFTPGPTPTLLIATNATFAALQLVLFTLLLVTHSLHFVALSILCAGLWFSINWFAQEVRAAQLAQDAEKEKDASKSHTDPGPADRKKDSGAGDSASETETEALAGKPAALATGSDRLQPPERDPKKRPTTGGDSSGYGSTDSEWEKVDDTRP